jgi:hypothetical protein
MRQLCFQLSLWQCRQRYSVHCLSEVQLRKMKSLYMFWGEFRTSSTTGRDYEVDIRKVATELVELPLQVREGNN